MSAATAADVPAPTTSTSLACCTALTAASKAAGSKAPLSAVIASIPVRADISRTAVAEASSASVSGGAKNSVVPRARAISSLSSVNPSNPTARAARTTLGAETPARAATCAAVLVPTNNGSESNNRTTLDSLAARSPHRACIAPSHLRSESSRLEILLPTLSGTSNSVT
ncbi:Uncharacterised protein [Mycobacteroides abscessus subsp. abscessus]|nr:Uncharacterised protein [Mycobacteroides abscessus subsp. abscessus]